MYMIPRAVLNSSSLILVFVMRLMGLHARISNVSWRLFVDYTHTGA